MAMFSRGFVLQQYKEPAFSGSIIRFVNPQTDSLSFPWEGKTGEDCGVDDIIEIAKAARIVDERDGRMLYRKLLRAKDRAVAVIADAVDDEPYVSSRIGPLLKLREEAVGGLQLCGRVAGTDEIYITVYKMITDLHTRIPRSLDGFPVMRLRGGYPAVSQASGIKVGQGRKLVVGIGALIHLYRAVMFRRRQSTVFLTVAGNCVANPMNLETSIGMTVTQVLERCGLSAPPSRIVCGGPMTGVAILDGERTLVTYTTRAVLAFGENKRDLHYSCLGCGRCEQVCPVGLNPMYINRFVQGSYYASLRPFDAHLCIGCGTCSYICPSKLNVSAAVLQAKEYAKEHFITPEKEEAEELDG